MSRRVAFSLGAATAAVVLSVRRFFAAGLVAVVRVPVFTFFRVFVPELEVFAERLDVQANRALVFRREPGE